MYRILRNLVLRKDYAVNILLLNIGGFLISIRPKLSGSCFKCFVPLQLPVGGQALQYSLRQGRPQAVRGPFFRNVRLILGNLDNHEEGG